MSWTTFPRARRHRSWTGVWNAVGALFRSFRRPFQVAPCTCWLTLVNNTFATRSNMRAALGGEGPKPTSELMGVYIAYLVQVCLWRRLLKACSRRRAWLKPAPLACATTPSHLPRPRPFSVCRLATFQTRRWWASPAFCGCPRLRWSAPRCCSARPQTPRFAARLRPGHRGAELPIVVPLVAFFNQATRSHKYSCLDGCRCLLLLSVRARRKRSAVLPTGCET